MSKSPLRYSMSLVLSACIGVTVTSWAPFARSQAAYSEANLTLASRGGVVVKISDIDDMLISAKPSERSTIVSSAARLEQIIDSRLLALQLVSKGKLIGINEDPIVQRRLAIAVDKAMGEIVLDELVNRASAVDVDILAKETYASRKNEFVTPENWTVSHLLVKPSEGEDAKSFLARATEAYNLATLPNADFVGMVKAKSDDPSVAQNGGEFTIQRNSEFVPEFLRAVVKLNAPGQFAPLTKTQFGYHVIRLLKKSESKLLTFDEARPTIVEGLIEDVQERMKTEILSDLRSADPKYVEENIRKLVVRYDPPLTVAPVESAAPSPAAASGAPK